MRAAWICRFLLEASEPVKSAAWKIQIPGDAARVFFFGKFAVAEYFMAWETTQNSKSIPESAISN